MNISLFTVYLKLSSGQTYRVDITLYNNINFGQLQLGLTVPPAFYDTYINATYNTSYFEIILKSHISLMTTSIGFAPEYLGKYHMLKLYIFTGFCCRCTCFI